MRSVAIVLLVLLPPSLAAAQSPAPMSQPPASPPVASDPGMAPKPPGETGRSGARERCRNEARSSGLRGAEARDRAQVCIAEARLACTKEAVAKGLKRAERRDFLKTCGG